MPSKQEARLLLLVIRGSCTKCRIPIVIVRIFIIIIIIIIRGSCTKCRIPIVIVRIFFIIIIIIIPLVKLNVQPKP